MDQSTRGDAVESILDEMGVPGIFIRPGIVQAVSLIGGRTIHHFYPIHVVAGSSLQWLGWTLIGASLVLLIWSAWEFKRRETSAKLRERAAVMVKTGPYRFSRNPFYVGLLGIILGVGFRLNSVWILAMFIPVFLFLHYGVILPEETYLERRFPEQYEAYKGAVRRYL